jgi:hypothetical protein
MADQRTLPALTAAMFAVSFSLVLFELLLTRLFAVVIFAQFAHLALALALLGISVGAVLQHVRPSLVPEEGLERRLGLLLLLQGVTTLFAVWCTLEFPVTTQFETPPVTYQERSSIAADLIDPVWFGALLPVLAVPFTIAGLAFAGTFQRRKKWIGRLYGADLLGGAVGAVAFLPLLTMLAGPDTVFVILAVTCGAAFALLRERADDLWTRVAGGLSVVAVLSSLIGLGGTEILKVKYAAGYAEENVEYVHWTPLTRLAVHQDDKRGAYILLDNSSASQVVRSVPQRTKLTKEETRSLVYRLHEPPGHVAILAASAGPEVAVAQHFGFTDVEAIDIAGEIFDIVGDRFAEDPTNPFTQGGTKRVKSDGRAAILHSEPVELGGAAVQRLVTLAARDHGCLPHLSGPTEARRDPVVWSGSNHHVDRAGQRGGPARAGCEEPAEPHCLREGAVVGDAAQAPPVDGGGEGQAGGGPSGLPTRHAELGSGQDRSAG